MNRYYFKALFILIIFCWKSSILTGQVTKLSNVSHLYINQFVITNDYKILVLTKDGQLYYNQYNSITHHKSNFKFENLFTNNDKYFINTKDNVYQIFTRSNIIELVEVLDTKMVNNKKIFGYLGDLYIRNDSLLLTSSDTINLPPTTEDIFIDNDKIYVSTLEEVKIYDQVNWKSLSLIGYNLANINQFAQNEQFITYSRNNNLILFDKTSFDEKSYVFKSRIDEIKIDKHSNLWILSAGQIFYIDLDNSPIVDIKLEKLFINNKIQSISNSIKLNKDTSDVKLIFDIRESIPYSGKFYLMIDGIHQEWQELTSNTYSINLPHGRFTLLTKSSINGEDNIKEVLSFKSNNESSNWVFYSLLATSGFLLLIVIWLYFRNENQLKKLKDRVKYLQTKSALTSSQLRALQLQINPHFLFNSLNNIQGLITIGASNKAKSQLRSFALLMRKVLDYSDKEYISISEDINFLTNYLELEKVNYNNKFKFKISLDPNLNSKIKIPPMITQIPVENAILHGVSSLNKEGEIEINYFKSNDQLHIEVIDNGTGIQNHDKDHSPKGLNMIKKRLKSNNAVEIKNIIMGNQVVGCKTLIRIKI